MFQYDKLVLNYDYTQKIEDEQIIKLIKLFRELPMKDKYESLEGAGKVGVRLRRIPHFNRSRLGNWTIIWLQYAFLKG